MFLQNQFQPIVYYFESNDKSNLKREKFSDLRRYKRIVSSNGNFDETPSMHCTDWTVQSSRPFKKKYPLRYSLCFCLFVLGFVDCSELEVRQSLFPFQWTVLEEVPVVGHGSSKTVIAHWILALTQFKFRIAQQFYLLRGLPVAESCKHSPGTGSATAGPFEDW